MNNYYLLRNISPVENLSVAIAALGEGWHNYHHVFPWDYKTGEFGSYTFNITTGFIDAFAKLGWAFDSKQKNIFQNIFGFSLKLFSLFIGKSVSPSMISRRADRCGDGTHFLDSEEAHKNPLWGYGDEDIDDEDKQDLLKMQE